MLESWEYLNSFASLALQLADQTTFVWLGCRWNETTFPGKNQVTIKGYLWLEKGDEACAAAFDNGTQGERVENEDCVVYYPNRKEFGTAMCDNSYHYLCDGEGKKNEVMIAL